MFAKVQSINAFFQSIHKRLGVEWNIKFIFPDYPFTQGTWQELNIIIHYELAAGLIYWGLFNPWVKHLSLFPRNSQCFPDSYVLPLLFYPYSWPLPFLLKLCQVIWRRSYHIWQISSEPWLRWQQSPNWRKIKTDACITITN